MFNFNDEEKTLHDIYKGNTKEETIQNIEQNLHEAPEEIKRQLIRIKDKLENGN